jgi:ElaB/YqjD/DUF883 family membrane-anchored ribosome-binding protein
MNDPKRQEIKDRIAASQARQQSQQARPLGDRLGESAIETKDNLAAFAKEHPYLTVGAGLAAGILIAGMFPSARRAARKGGTQAAAIGALGTEVVMSTLHDLLGAGSEAGRAGAERVDDFGDAIGDTARQARRDAGYMAAQASDQARIARRNTGKSLSRILHRLTR